VGTWLAERFTLAGVLFQNWMLVAVAIVLVAGPVASNSNAHSAVGCLGQTGRRRGHTRSTPMI
jgi:hypothetical protein